MTLQDALTEAYRQAQATHVAFYIFSDAYDNFYVMPPQNVVSTDKPHTKVYPFGLYASYDYKGFNHVDFDLERNFERYTVWQNRHQTIQDKPVKSEQLQPDVRQNVVSVRYDPFTGFAD